MRGYLLPMTSDSSFYADLIQMPESQPLDTRADYENYLKRLAAIPPTSTNTSRCCARA